MNIFGNNPSPENLTDVPSDPNGQAAAADSQTTPPQMGQAPPPVVEDPEDEDAGNEGEAPTAEQLMQTKPIETVSLDRVVLSHEAKDKAKPKGILMIGRDKFDLPSVEQQLAGFKVAKGGILVAQFPGVYKFLKDKGQPTPSVTI